MDFEIDPELAKVIAQFGIATSKNTAEKISDKLRTIKVSKNKDEIINNYEQIINDLISDKYELIRIADIFQQQLVAQTISDDEIIYITQKVIPILEELLSNSNEDTAQDISDLIEVLKPLLSKETFNILQLLGFNFKQALGDPLTKLIRSSILANAPVSKSDLELQKLIEQRSIEYWRMLQNEKAFERYKELNGI